MRKGLFFILLVACVVALSACAHDINVKDSLVAEDNILPAVSLPGPIDVQGTAPQNAGMVKFCKAGGNTFLTDFDKFTAYAVASATDILHRNHIETMDGAKNKLVLSVADATCEQESFDVNFIAHVDAACGDQPTKRFTGNQRIWTLHGIDFAMSAAVLNATVAAFGDEQILDCLKNR
jgi:hypothetical protein